MDKKLWLRVIREELELLNQLATGMIGDDHLTKEEVELAISRSKIVAKEFEMLLGQVSVKLPEPKVTEKAEPLPTGSTVVLEPDPIVKAESEPEEPLVILPVEPAGIPFVFPIAEYQFPDVVPEVEQQENPVVAVPEPEKVLPRSSFFRPLREEPPALNIDLKREDNSLFKPTPIKSLKEGLILNDRYLFQRELFNNDKSRLDETVAALDRLSNIHEAVEYLKANFRWTKSEASEKFVQLVKRRFSEPKG
jgi:hypothetical protein